MQAILSAAGLLENVSYTLQIAIDFAKRGIHIESRRIHAAVYRQYSQTTYERTHFHVIYGYFLLLICACPAIQFRIGR